MKILIVEDDENNIALFEGELAETAGCEAVIARSRDSALTALQNNLFDLVVIDLRIPTQDGGLDADTNHGLVVHTYVQEHSRGTPIIIFSAYGTVRLATKLTETCERHDVWGSGQEQQMTSFKEKTEFSECLALIRETIGHIAALSSIDISSGGKNLIMADEEKRVLRIFARLNGGVNVVLSPLGGGLSGAKTYRMEVQNQHGAVTCFAAAKIGPINEIEDEAARYQKCISPVIALGSFAHIIQQPLKAGAGNFGGLFYGFAREYEQTLLDLLVEDPGKAAMAVGHLQKMEDDWHKNAPLKTVKVQELRRAMVSDDEFSAITRKLPFDWNTIEQMDVRVKWCCQHRDLHVLNVLVRDGKVPLLIDYGEDEHGPACLDPLTLELGLLFHPSCKALRAAWPKAEQAKKWANLNEFVDECPVEKFVRVCRTWAHSVQSVDKGLYATAYAYAVRQLKFPDIDEPSAIAIATSCFEKLTEA